MTDLSITPRNLIAADRVNGTDVYNLQGDKLGTVADIMIDKVSGRAIYAVMSFGGFLGIGEKHHPLPWSTLKYDERQGGYVVALDKKVLEGAPTFDDSETFSWTPDYGRQQPLRAQRRAGRLLPDGGRRPAFSWGDLLATRPLPAIALRRSSDHRPLHDTALAHQR
eukprot:gene54422-72726_t